MKNSTITIDDFCPDIDAVKASAFQSGFGTWAPAKGVVGTSIFEGMSFWGLHAPMLRSLAAVMGVRVFPNDMFFRVCNTDTETAYIHSDRMWGTHTCIVYLTEHTEISGTAFYRHRETGLREMPTFEEMQKQGIFEKLKENMVSAREEDWEQLSFVRGLKNRALIFHAPQFHARIPRHGIGTNAENGRLIWACHFQVQ